MFLNTDKNVLSINEIISRECLCGMQLKLQYRQILVFLSIPRRVPWGMANIVNLCLSRLVHNEINGGWNV